MKKVFLGILALTLIFGMAVIGCDDGNSGNNENGNDSNLYAGDWIADHPSQDNQAPDYLVITLKNDSTFIWQEEKDKVRTNALKGTYSINNDVITFTITQGWTGGNDAKWDNSQEMLNKIKTVYINSDALTMKGIISGSTTGSTITIGHAQGKIVFTKGGTGSNSNENPSENSGGIQVYNQDGTVFTGNDTGTIWYANGFIQTDRGDDPVAANINITNGKLSDFLLPESVNENLLHSGALGGPGTAKTGVLMITLSSGKNLRLLSENSVGYYFYSKGAKNNVKN